jgi:hypothetical protein
VREARAPYAGDCFKTLPQRSVEGKQSSVLIPRLLGVDLKQQYVLAIESYLDRLQI